MSARRLGCIALVCFWLIVGMGYVWAAGRQKQRINLSAAAGGQYPYLVYTRQVAEAGVTRHFGDRNRMPLYPSLLALAYDEDWDTFVARSAWFAIVSSLVILVGIGGLAYRSLPPWPATALTLTAVIAVFIPKASFVQAELLYYGLLFASWLLLCRVIRRPGAWWALPAGVLLGLTYLTKASGAATLAAFVAAVGVHGIVVAWPAKRPAVRNLEGPVSPRARDVLLSGVIVVVTFLAVTYPYLSNNQARFGRYFYNVNSTFFMWCDSWEEAQAFADAHHISEHYPATSPDEIPGPLNYWRTHSLKRILGRLGYGFRTLAALAWHGPYAKYLALVVVFCTALAAGQVRRLARFPFLRIVLTPLFPPLSRGDERGVRYTKSQSALEKPALEDWIIGLFCAMFFVGYLLSYAWYARVAYGDRFLLSLFLPTMFAVWWWACRLSHSIPPKRFLGVTRPLSDFLAVGLVLLLLAEGGYALTTSLYRPTPTFVRFYYNESRELLAAGNVGEATRGFKGVIELDPTFAAAHHDLGIIALRAGRLDQAIETLTEAVRHDPGVADLHNSLGSALVQAGRTEEAVRAFRRATDLDPEFAIAWYNLGGSCLRSGLVDEARAVQRRLELLDPRLAEQLTTLFAD